MHGNAMSSIRCLNALCDPDCYESDVDTGCRHCRRTHGHTHQSGAATPSEGVDGVVPSQSTYKGKDHITKELTIAPAAARAGTITPVRFSA